MGLASLSGHSLGSHIPTSKQASKLTPRRVITRFFIQQSRRHRRPSPLSTHMARKKKRGRTQGGKLTWYRKKYGRMKMTCGQLVSHLRSHHKMKLKAAQRYVYRKMGGGRGTDYVWWWGAWWYWSKWEGWCQWRERPRGCHLCSGGGGSLLCICHFGKDILNNTRAGCARSQDVAASSSAPAGKLKSNQRQRPMG